VRFEVDPCGKTSNTDIGGKARSWRGLLLQLIDDSDMKGMVGP